LLKTYLGKPVVEPHQSAESVDESCVYKLITGANLQTVFPNIEVRLRLRIYLCLMATNCSGERTFLPEAKTHQERATFNNASTAIESPNVDEPRTRGVARDRTQTGDR